MALAAGSGAYAQQSLDGRWDAQLVTKTGVVPFRLDISGEGATLKGTLYNGWDPFETTTGASFKDGQLVLRIDHYLTRVTATLKDGELDGKVVSQSRADAATYGFHAKRYVAAVTSSEAPAIAGSWEIPLDKPNAKGEKTQRLIVQQSGPEVSASILRVDGDTGALNGVYKDGKWVLSHWDGSRPGVMEVSLQPDGTLAVKQEGGRAGNKLIAYRTEVARAKGIAEPEDYTTHTTMRDPNEVLGLEVPGCERQSSVERRSEVQGEGCAGNRRPEPGARTAMMKRSIWFELYAKYHDQGLEIVALDLKSPSSRATSIACMRSSSSTTCLTPT